MRRRHDKIVNAQRHSQSNERSEIELNPWLKLLLSIALGE